MSPVVTGSGLYTVSLYGHLQVFGSPLRPIHMPSGHTNLQTGLGKRFFVTTDFIVNSLTFGEGLFVGFSSCVSVLIDSVAGLWLISSVVSISPTGRLTPGVNQLYIR